MNRLHAGFLAGVMLLTVSVPAWTHAAETPKDETAKEILALAGVPYGLCLHLGCGRSESPGLTAALAANSSLLVHGLAWDDDSVARARKAAGARGVLGLAMTEKGETNALPYRRDLASLVVVEDPAALAKQGIGRDEILRVTAPGGILCSREGGKWTKSVKPRPREMDEWTHPAHGPDGNMVSTDRALTFPIGYRWIDGLPANITAWASCRGWVVAGGRCYTLSQNEIENLGPNRRTDHYLAVRDAYSGLPLWKINCATTDDGARLNWRNAGPLAADGQRVCAVQTNQIIVVDGVTGKIMATCPTKYQAARLLLADGILVASCWQNRDGARAEFEGTWLWSTWYPGNTNGVVEAFDPGTGASKWSLPLPAHAILASGGTLYLLTHAGNPSTNSQVTAVELATGREKWSVPCRGLGSMPARVPGKGGDAIAFENGWGASVASVKGLAPSNSAHTVAAWIRVTRLPAESRGWMLLLGNPGNGAHQWLLDRTGEASFGVWGGAGVKSKFPAGEWKHVTMTFDGTTLKHFVDGGLSGSTNASFNLQGIQLSVALAPNAESSFEGQIGGLRLYPRALSAEEVAALAKMKVPPAGKSGEEKDDAILCWSLAGKDAALTADSSGNGNSGVFKGSMDFQLNAAFPGGVVVAKRKDKAVFVLSAKDGRELWRIPGARNIWTPIVDGLMWHDTNTYDIATGTIKGTLPVSAGANVQSLGCTPSTILGGRYLVRSRDGRYFEFPEEGSTNRKPRELVYNGARGGCMEGMTPANGMFYTPQNNCGCSPAQIPGFLAVGPSGEWPTPADFAKPRPVEKGPAFGSPAEDAAGTNDWPTFRANAARSAAAAAHVPAELRELWRAPCALPGEGRVADAWKARVTSCLSAPVIAGGRVFVAATDRGQLFALDAAKGTRIWTVTLGSRIDTPPTIHQGLCLVGCHDGWVYALRARDGQLAWRMRAAPAEQRLVAHGMVESVWPVTGSVLVHEGVAYANAGRSSESDGGVAVVAFKPETGETLWASGTQGNMRPNDLLAVRDSALAWHHRRIEFKTGQHRLYGAQDTGLGGMLDGSWTVVNNRRRAGKAFALGRVTADLMAWNETWLATPTFAMERAKANPLTPEQIKEQKRKDGNLVPADYAWQLKLPKGQVEAMALADNAVLYAGRLPDPAANVFTGFLLAVSNTDGSRKTEIPLDAPPTYDGLALAGDRVYLSLYNGMLACFGR